MESASNASRGLGSKFLLTVIPGLVASGVAASVLYAIHVSRAPAVSEYLSLPTSYIFLLSAEERRDLTRQMLKARRENPEQPAEVQPLSPPDAAGGSPMDGDATAAGAANSDPRLTDIRAPDPVRVPDTAKPDTTARVVPDRVPGGGADLPIRMPDTPAVTDARPADASADVRAVDAKPTEVRPADTKSVDARPVDARPVDARPVDAKPVDAARPQGGVAVRVAPATAPDKPAAVATAPLPPPRPPARPRPETPAAASAQPPAPPLPPPAVAAAPAAPTQLQPPGGAQIGGTQTGGTQAGPAQAGAAEAAGAPPPEQQHGFASNVLSGLSSVAGSAANATGNTVNWVIDLPGRAIHAGGKLIGIKRDADDQTSAPAAAPPPPGSPAPPAAKRNL